MYVPFDSLADSARVWIYQSRRKFTEIEKNAISDQLTAFTQQWAAHANPLKSSFTVLYDQFIVVAADESFSEASGCSIDGSVRVLKGLDAQFGLGLFDRTNVVFWKNENTELVKMAELVTTRDQQQWDHDTLVFNNVVATKGDLNTNWRVPAGLMWLKRYLPTVRQAD